MSIPTPPPPKRRRGRQPRPSLLPPNLKSAVSDFAHLVGQPRVIEPAGFRDFRGWLAHIASPAASHYWQPLVNAVMYECSGDLRQVHRLKPDLVREIVKAVVIPREGESSKLVSTNCGRQCARPASGVTLMVILDRVFGDRDWFDRLERKSLSRQADKWVMESAAVRVPRGRTHPAGVKRALPLPYGEGGREHQKEMVWDGSHRVWGESGGGRTSMSLPSFRELEDSLSKKPYLGKPRR